MSQIPPLDDYDALRTFLECPDLTDDELKDLIKQIEALANLLVDDYLASLPMGARIVKK